MNSNEFQGEKDFLPMSITPKFDAIPQTLKFLPRFLVWQLHPAEPKNKKVPMTFKNGNLFNADVKKPENWLTFDEAINLYNQGLCTGIGFALTDTPPKICCVDVDHCFTEEGSLNEIALAVLETCQNSWAEKSQSGEGIHIWFIDEEFSGGRRKDPVEVYGSDRYIALTGVKIDSSAEELLTQNGICRNVIEKFIDVGKGAENQPALTEKIICDTNATLSDADKKFVEYFRSQTCKKRDLNIFLLFNGDKEKFFERKDAPVNDSVADFDLMLKILTYVSADEADDKKLLERALAIFGQSELAKREKWQAREDYRLRTAQEAFSLWQASGRKTIRKKVENGDFDAKIKELQKKLADIQKDKDDFEAEIETNLEKLRSVISFDNKTVFEEELLQAAAFACVYDKALFVKFRADVKVYGNKHPEQKVYANDWLAEIKTRVNEIKNRSASLSSMYGNTLGEINTTVFVKKHYRLQDVDFPYGYSFTDSGVFRIVGEKSILVCHKPVLFSKKNFDVEEKKYKWILSYFEEDKWKDLPPFEAQTISSRNKIIELANCGLPVTTTTADELVNFLHEYFALNEEDLPLTYYVTRCGWHNLRGKDYFIDPRRQCVLTDGEDGDKTIDVKVDCERSAFAQNLKAVGSLDKWRDAYAIAKKSPVARLIVSAAVAPILLKILGERNFLLYICAPTRAGKTTALYLAASVLGSEKIIRSFDATKNGLVGAAADVNDYPFLIDEKQVADNRLKDNFSELVYALANGIGRTKLNRDSTLKKLHDWRTIAVATGETLLFDDTVTGGANTRVLTIKAPKEILSAADCKFIRDTVKENFGLIFPLVIDKAIEHGKEKLRSVFEEMLATFAERFSEILPEHRRYMATLAIGDTLLNSVIYGNTVLREGEKIKAVDDSIINAAQIFPLIPTIGEIADAPREKEFVLGFIAQNQNRFVGRNTDISKMLFVYGILNDADGYSYITVQSLREACKSAGFDFKKLADDLVADGFFIPADKIEKGRKSPLATVVKKIGKVNVRCFRIKNEFFDANK